MKRFTKKGWLKCIFKPSTLISRQEFCLFCLFLNHFTPGCPPRAAVSETLLLKKDPLSMGRGGGRNWGRLQRESTGRQEGKERWGWVKPEGGGRTAKPGGEEPEGSGPSTFVLMSPFSCCDSWEGRDSAGKGRALRVGKGRAGDSGGGWLCWTVKGLRRAPQSLGPGMTWPGAAGESRHLQDVSGWNRGCWWVRFCGNVN